MEMAITISLEVSVDDPGANLNEICAEVKKKISGELCTRVAEEIIKGMQDHLRDVLCAPVGRVAKKGKGRHERRRTAGVLCRFRTFIKEGYRQTPRRVKTDIGEVSFPVGYVSCVGCGKKVAPILSALGLEGQQRHSAGLERVVSEVVTQTSYKRGEAEIVARGSAPVPKTSAHRWVSELDVPSSSATGSVFGMADGTGFKKWPGERGDLRVVIGLSPEGEIKPLGTYSGKSWEEIGHEVRQKLRDDATQLELFAVDGEIGLDRHLATEADHAQRCIWHVPRDLKYAMWEDHAPLQERKQMAGKVAGLVGIEVPAEDWEDVSRKDKSALQDAVKKNEEEMKSLAHNFREKGYPKAATYLENAMGNVFSHVRLWLETGVVAPRTTSILENIMREIGRRAKKLGWNWTDDGVVQMTKMVLLRRYDEAEWNSYWKRKLDLQNRCRINITSITRQAA
jgi:hypothetical protein